MRVKDFMNSAFQSCHKQTPLIEAVHIFSTYRVNIIPIVDDKNSLIGLLTKNKIISAISEGYSLSDAIYPLINLNPICIFMDDDVYQTRQKLLKNKIGHAPVIDSNNQVVGLISTRQILFVYTRVVDMLQSQLQLLFDSLQFGLLSVDKNMNITAVNPLARKILQLPKDKEDVKNTLIKNEIISDMITYTLVNQEKPHKQKVKLNGSSFLIDCSPLFERNKLTGVMVIMDDLTNLEQLLMELETTKQWEEKLRTVIESAYDAVLLVNEDGFITMANKGFCELFDTNESKVIGKSINIDFPDLGINEVLKMKTPLTGISKTINSKQCLVTNLPISNNGELVGVVSKITFRGLQQLQDALNKVSRLEDNQILLQQTESEDTKYLISDIIGSSNQIKKVKKEAYAATRSKSTVLLIG